MYDFAFVFKFQLNNNCNRERVVPNSEQMENANFQLVVLGDHLYYSKWLVNICVQSH